MAKLAFLGLGQMGTPMATRLLNAGHDLTVWNRTSAKTKPLVDLGASATETPAEAVAGADAAITMVATPEALEEVMFGAGGIVRGTSPGQYLIDMSTVGPDTIRSVAARLPDHVTFTDAPVRGSVPEATEGTLQIYVGGTDAAFEAVEPLLRALGTPRHVGPLGAGAATKLVINLTLGVVMTAAGEALALGEALGLGRPTLLDSLEGSPIGGIVRGKRANIESGSYPPSFQLRHALKDIRLVTDTAARSGEELALAAATRGWFERAAEAGYADRDFSAVVATILAAARGRAGAS